MNSRCYTKGLSVAEIIAKGGKNIMEKYKVQPLECRNPKCLEFFKCYVFLKSHIMNKKQKFNCYQFYKSADALEEIQKKAKCESIHLRKMTKKIIDGQASRKGQI